MARKYHSPLLQSILDRITPLTKMEVSNKMDIAIRIDDLIKEKGWSKIQFAEKVNKNPSEITRWLGGGHNFTIDTLCEIAIAFGLELKDLFEHSPNNAIAMQADIKFAVLMKPPVSVSLLQVINLQISIQTTLSTFLKYLIAKIRILKRKFN